MLKSEQYKYDVALSFAGEQRSYVEAVYKALKRRRIRVFYDEDPDVQAAHLGKRFSVIAEKVYNTLAQFVVLFVSKEYVTKQWPYLEAAHVLDMMRSELFQGNRVLVGNFDQSKLPGFPSDVWYEDLQTKSADDFAKTILRAIKLRRKLDQDAILALCAREKHDVVVESLTSSLDAGLSYEDTVFALYNRACASSRLSQQLDDASPDVLHSAANDIERCLQLVGENRPQYLADLSDWANKDDDLLALRTCLPERMQGILGVDKLNLGSTGTSNNKSGGCVNPDVIIATPSGGLAMMDLDVSSVVLCFDRDANGELRSTLVSHKHLFAHQPRYSINGKITISSSQPLCEFHLGWSCPPAWKAGMSVLRSDGTYEEITDIQRLDPGPVMVIGVDDGSHTFIANGFVCHNSTK